MTVPELITRVTVASEMLGELTPYSIHWPDCHSQQQRALEEIAKVHSRLSKIIFALQCPEAAERNKTLEIK